MNHKRLICLALVFIIALSFFVVLTRLINAQTVPVLSIVPTGESGATSTTIIPAQAIGTTFSVDVRVDDYSSVNIGGASNGVSACSYSVTWDPTVLEFTSYTDGNWLPGQENFGDLANQVTSGQLTIGQIAFDVSDASATADSSSGSVSANITFTVLSTGSSALALQPSSAGVAYLQAPETVGGTTSNHDVTGTTTVNAQYGTSTSPTPTPTPSPTPSPSSTPTSSPTPSPIPTSSPSPTPTPNPSTYGPTAIISIENGTNYETGSQITLVGNSSTGGQDGQSSCPITNWAWLVQFSNDTVFGSYSGSAVSFVENNPTSFKITLIVTAPDTVSPPNRQYTNTSTTSVWINVELPQQLTNIDVFTQNGGVGHDAPSGPFGPQQLVQLYANVTYNGAGVANKDVTFTVTDPNGNIIAIMTALTNLTGIAYQEYRTPWPASGNPDFGTWSVMATVDVSQVVVTDSVSFEYNYLVTTNGITVPASVERQSPITITVALESTDNVPLNSTVAITIFDQNEVPIDTYMTNLSNAINSTVSATVTIPSWAFVGTATVDVNVLTNTPANDGVPYYPQQTATFQILP